MGLTSSHLCIRIFYSASHHSKKLHKTKPKLPGKMWKQSSGQIVLERLVLASPVLCLPYCLILIFFQCRSWQTPPFGWAPAWAGSFYLPKIAKSHHIQFCLGTAGHGEGFRTLHRLRASQKERQFAFGQVATCKNCNDGLFLVQKPTSYALTFPQHWFLPNQLLDFNLGHSARRR